MKRLKILTGVICLIMVSCIPSLHPIYTENTMILDDRILGKWVDEGITDFLEQANISVSELTEAYLDELEGSIQSDSNTFGFDEAGLWKFERSADVSYERIKEDGTTISSHFEDHPSESYDKKLLAKGYQVKSKRLNPYYTLVYKNYENEFNQIELVKVVLTEINGDLYIDFQTHPNVQEPTRFSINRIPAHTFAKLNFENGDMYIQSFNSEYIEELITNKRVKLKHELMDDSILLTASTEELRAFIEKYGKNEDLYTSKMKLIRI